MRRKTRFFGAVLTTTALLCSGTSVAAAGAESPEAARPAVQDAMAELAKSGAAGVQVRIEDGEGTWTGRAGVAELNDPAPVPEDGRFRVGSISKTMVATALLQLVDEGEVRLDRPATEYLPQFELDERITVRMLLQHTSGLFNYTGEANPDGTFEPGIPLRGQEFVDKRFDTYHPEQLVELALSKPARFEPGTRWSYSNTNYVLAALIIESVTGNAHADELRERIFEPVGMRDTSVPSTEPEMPEPHAHGYFGFAHGDGTKVVDVTELNPSWAYGAGEVISTTEDLDEFYTALLDGELLSPRSLEEMRTMRPVGQGAGYGLGLQRMDLGACGTFLGHTGSIPGYASYAFSAPDQNKRVEISVTTGGFDQEDLEASQRYTAATQEVLVNAMCGPQAPGEQKSVELLSLR